MWHCLVAQSVLLSLLLCALWGCCASAGAAAVRSCPLRSLTSRLRARRGRNHTQSRHCRPAREQEQRACRHSTSNRHAAVPRWAACEQAWRRPRASTQGETTHNHPVQGSSPSKNRLHAVIACASHTQARQEKPHAITASESQAQLPPEKPHAITPKQGNTTSRSRLRAGEAKENNTHNRPKRDRTQLLQATATHSHAKRKHTQPRHAGSTWSHGAPHGGSAGTSHPELR